MGPDANKPDTYYFGLVERTGKRKKLNLLSSSLQEKELRQHPRLCISKSWGVGEA